MPSCRTSTSMPRRAAWRTCCGEGRRGWRPRRDHAPERPVLPGLLLRRPQAGSRRRADERAAEKARGRLLPQGPRGQGAVRLARLRRGGGGRRRGGRHRADPGQAGRVRGAHRQRRAHLRHGRSRRGRHRGDPLHVGHDRNAEGRRAHALQSHAQRRGVHELHGHRRDRGDPRGAAAVSLLRADLWPERGRPGRSLPDPDPALRSRQGAGDHRSRQRERVRGRADDVRGDAQPPRQGQVRYLLPGALRIRRLGDAGRGDEGVRGRLQLQGPRGLRPLGDLTRGVLQPPRP